MERVKDLKQLIIKSTDVLVEIKRSTSLIITGGDKETTFDYAIVIKAGHEVIDLAPGDIILAMSGGNGFNIKKNGTETTYVLISRYGITMAVEAENFDFNAKSNFKLTNNKSVN
jgi:hypothetical protein